jgi:hypothetical protein
MLISFKKALLSGLPPRKMPWGLLNTAVSPLLDKKILPGVVPLITP